MVGQYREIAGVEFHSVKSEWAEKESQDYSGFYEALEAWRRRDDKVKESRMGRVHD